jgi:hypothetical protein
MQLDLRKEPLPEPPKPRESKPTRLRLFSSEKDIHNLVRTKMSNLVDLNHILQYNYHFEMPRVIVEKQADGKWLHLLQFTYELPEKELEQWRWFKLGLLTYYYD